MGDIPTKVLSDTLIGKTVNQIAKASSDEIVRTSARELVEDWRQKHRKRKSGNGEMPPLKRSFSSSLSLSRHRAHPHWKGRLPLLTWKQLSLGKMKKSQMCSVTKSGKSWSKLWARRRRSRQRVNQRVKKQ